MIAFLKANSNYDIKDTLPDCKAKALIVVGGRERAIMKRSAELIADALPASSMVIMRDYYHGELSINHSEEYAQKLLQLINM